MKDRKHHFRSKLQKSSIAALAIGMSTALISTAGATATSAATRHTTHHKITTITLYSSGDVNVQDLWQNNLVPLFQKTHPSIRINLIFSEHGTTDVATLARLSASVKAHTSFSFDVMDSGVVASAAQANLLQKLDKKVVPLIGTVDPKLLKQNHYETLPYRGSSVVLAYNTNFVTAPPKNLDGLISWIKANPGKFTYNSPDTGGSGSAFVQAVLNQNISAGQHDQMVSGYDPSLESAWNKGFQTLKDLGPSIYRNGFYPNGNAAVLQLLGSSSIWMAPVWSDMALGYKAQQLLPPSIKLVQLHPPLNGGPANLAVPINGSHIRQADMFLNWVLTPAVQTIIINRMNGYPGVEWKYVPKTVRDKFAAIASAYNLGYSSQFSSDMNKQWATKVAASN